MNIWRKQPLFCNIIKTKTKGGEMQKVLFLQEKQQQDILNYMPKDSTLSRLADFFSVFADATRIKILTALCMCEMCVNDLSVMLNMNQTTVSHQLKLLKQNGAVTCSRVGKMIYYSITDGRINDVMLNGVDYLLAN